MTAHRQNPATGFYRRTARRFLCAGLLFGAGLAQAQGTAAEMRCEFGNLHNDGAGPYDYRTERRALPVVERRHFTPRVEALMSGESTTNPGPDLRYTLNKFPNHHRALMSLIRLGEKLNAERDPEMPQSIPCYFERALAFRPDDTLVRLIYATYLGKRQRVDQALQQLALAQKDAGDNGITHYNLGLVYSDLKRYDEALASAHRAMALGVERGELRDRLQKAGKWSEPAVAAQAAASAPAEKVEPAASAAESPASSASR